jgi:hypothetical protein
MFHQTVVMDPTRQTFSEDEEADQLTYPGTTSADSPEKKPPPAWTFRDVINETRKRLALRGYRWD